MKYLFINVPNELKSSVPVRSVVSSQGSHFWKRYFLICEVHAEKVAFFSLNQGPIYSMVLFESSEVAVWDSSG